MKTKVASFVVFSLLAIIPLFALPVVILWLESVNLFWFGLALTVLASLIYIPSGRMDRAGSTVAAGILLMILGLTTFFVINVYGLTLLATSVLTILVSALIGNLSNAGRKE